MKRNKKILIGIWICTILVCLMAAWMVNTHPPYTETVVLERQYIDVCGCGSSGPFNCLIMDVSDNGYNKTYYFVGENELKSDLVDGYPIEIQWKYIYPNGYYRIRNVYQPTPEIT